MSKFGGNKLQESEAERAFAQVAQERYADYKKRWQPLQVRAAETIKRMGGDDALERAQMKGQANLATRAAFSNANDQLEQSNQARGIRANSARAKLGEQALGQAEATSQGIGQMGADQAVDDAYTQGLSKIMAMGRGQSAQAIEGLGTAAKAGAQRAQFDASNALADATGKAQLIGQVAGIGAGLLANNMDGIKDWWNGKQAEFATGIPSGMPHPG